VTGLRTEEIQRAGVLGARDELT
jgi:hypothetical protein